MSLTILNMSSELELRSISVLISSNNSLSEYLSAILISSIEENRKCKLETMMERNYRTRNFSSNVSQ